MVSPRRISDFKPTLTNLAQTSQYQVVFGGLPYGLRNYLKRRGMDYRFVTETAGIMCSNAVLPGSTLAKINIKGVYTGVAEGMAHARVFTPMVLEFYVDNEYKVLKFLEHWMEYIANGSEYSQSRKDYYFRMEYPDDYKTYQTKILKFNRDYNDQIEYNFYGLYPESLSSVPVKYDRSEILKVSCTFHYDRYASGRYNSFSVWRGWAGNIEPTAPKQQEQGDTARDGQTPDTSGGNRNHGAYVGQDDKSTWGANDLMGTTTGSDIA